MKRAVPFLVAGVVAVALAVQLDLEPRTRFDRLLAGEALRDGWQRTPEIVQALEARPGAAVADIGAGDGYFTVRLARAVGPAGRVYAVDIVPKVLQRLRGRARYEGLANIEVIEGGEDDPHLPVSGVDAALLVMTYHEIPAHQAVLAAIRRSLKPGGRLVIIEAINEAERAKSRAEQEANHHLDARFVEADLRDAGFDVEERREPFLLQDGNTHWLIRAVVAPRPPGA